MFITRFCRRLDSNQVPLVLKATARQAEQQPLSETWLLLTIQICAKFNTYFQFCFNKNKLKNWFLFLKLNIIIKNVLDSIRASLLNNNWKLFVFWLSFICFDILCDDCAWVCVSFGSSPMCRSFERPFFHC